MNSYLLTLVLKPDLEEKARKELLETMKKKMTSDDGKIGKEDPWGVKDLSYQIKRQNKGYFVHFEFETNPKTAKGLDKELRVEEDIIRYLLIRR